jgi:hypothetical protein
VTPLLLASAGVLALVAAGLLLRTFGPRYRIARLLATTPRVTVAEANRMARDGDRAYVRVDGRIDAAEDFESPDHQPLVLRRVRLEARSGRVWRAFEDHRQVVPFAINEGLDTIAVDTDALDAGLVVVPRESVGTAADLVDRVPAGVAPDVPVRVRIDQLSSVEHAIVLGYPVPVAPTTMPPSVPPTSAVLPAPEPEVTPPSTEPSAPSARLTAGRSRPLILTVLETDEAMRVLAAEGRGRTRIAGALIAAAAILIAGSAVWALVGAVAPALTALVPELDGLVSVALAASPEASAATGGDPRSNGQGPGLVGTPGLAILAVATIGILAIVVTTIYVRLTAPGRRDDARDASRTDSGPRVD